MDKKHLFSVSHDTNFSETRRELLRKGDANLQIKLTKLCSETSSKQQLLMGYMLDLTITSMNERTQMIKLMRLQTFLHPKNYCKKIVWVVSNLQ